MPKWPLLHRPPPALARWPSSSRRCRPVFTSQVRNVESLIESSEIDLHLCVCVCVSVCSFSIVYIVHLYMKELNL